MYLGREGGKCYIFKIVRKSVLSFIAHLKQHSEYLFISDTNSNFSFYILRIAIPNDAIWRHSAGTFE